MRLDECVPHPLGCLCKTQTLWHWGTALPGVSKDQPGTFLREGALAESHARPGETSKGRGDPQPWARA